VEHIISEIKNIKGIDNVLIINKNNLEIYGGIHDINKELLYSIILSIYNTGKNLVKLKNKNHNKLHIRINTNNGKINIYDIEKYLLVVRINNDNIYEEKLNEYIYGYII